MPIEIKEITIKADVFPAGRESGAPAALPAADLDRLKKEITREVMREVLLRLEQNVER